MVLTLVLYMYAGLINFLFSFLKELLNSIMEWGRNSSYLFFFRNSLHHLSTNNLYTSLWLVHVHPCKLILQYKGRQLLINRKPSTISQNLLLVKSSSLKTLIFFCLKAFLLLRTANSWDFWISWFTLSSD